MSYVLPYKKVLRCVKLPICIHSASLSLKYLSPWLLELSLCLLVRWENEQLCGSFCSAIATIKRAENRRSFSVMMPTTIIPWDNLHLGIWAIWKRSGWILAFFLKNNLWLKPSYPYPDQVNLITCPCLNSDPQESGIGMLCMSNYQPLYSSDEATIHIKNNIAYLLPDMRLLKMQWALKHLTAWR